MQIGFKTGPNTWEEGKQLVLEDGAKLAEMWFRIDKAHEYADKFAWLAQQKVSVGLHHWGIIEGSYKTNLASVNELIRKATIQQVKDTIDVGARIDCVYVNVHCGAQGTEKIAFDPYRQELLPIDFSDTTMAERLLMESAKEIFEYAQQRSVVLTIETLPKLEQTDHTRAHTHDAKNIHHRILLKLKSIGGYIANDIVHTGTQLFKDSVQLDQSWQELLAFTQEAADITRLLHINTVTEPFDGTDSHNGMLAEDFAAGAWPSLEQIKELLRLFKDRDDVFVIPEPRDNMQKNYRALVNLCQELVLY